MHLKSQLKLLEAYMGSHFTLQSTELICYCIQQNNEINSSNSSASVPTSTYLNRFHTRNKTKLHQRNYCFKIMFQQENIQISPIFSKRNNLAFGVNITVQGTRKSYQITRKMSEKYLRCHIQQNAKFFQNIQSTKTDLKLT